MQLKRVTLILFTLFVITDTSGQNYEPLELAKKIFSDTASFDIIRFSTGEYKLHKGAPNVNNILVGVTANFSLLFQTEKNAVVGMFLSDTAGLMSEYYLVFEQDTIWKMEAFRSANSDFIEERYKALIILTPAQIDEIITNGSSEVYKFGSFSSINEFEFMVGNSKLMLASIAELEQHFFNNEQAFERLKTLAILKFKEDNQDQQSSIISMDQYTADYQELFITSVYTGGYYWKNVINFSFGGAINDYVGFMYVEDKKHIPELNPNNIFMIKELGNGWYIYRN